MLAGNALQQQVEITVARGQHHFVDIGRRVHDVDGDTHVPVALGRAIAALDIRFEFYDKTEVAQDLLKLLLLAVTPVNRIGIGLDNFAALADISPQGGVIEMAAIGLANRVLKVLHIREDRNFFHR